MSLNHDFLLLDRDHDGEWELLRFINDPRAIHLHDDFVRYVQDTLAWIPTTNPARGERQRGLCMWGPTLIELEGAGVAERVFAGWAELLAAGPPRLELTGRFSCTAADDAPAAGEPVTELEGGHDRLEFDRDDLVVVLRQLTRWCSQVRSGAGRLYLYHGGV
ncbi:hypothetical protein [Gemmata sp.]|uniref:hypothetical protein n=1 Tax=Gemmata sp. TaxID=1914242 RepID=UPI003F6E68F1